ncbi:hypothetical protein Acsp02_32160 [Actinoplanes sp. NBRC 103695]|nr:hypothetical protein Acsp02_32160 [Actinoplanes sp. NBRC 103695]
MAGSATRAGVYHCVPGYRRERRQRQQVGTPAAMAAGPDPTPSASGGTDGEQAPGGLASRPDPTPSASGGSDGEQAPRRLAALRPRPNRGGSTPGRLRQSSAAVVSRRP